LRFPRAFRQLHPFIDGGYPAFLLTIACLTVGCTKVLEPAPPPPPAEPVASPTRPKSALPRRPPSATAAVSPAAPAQVAPSDTLNGDPNGLKREALNEALQKALAAMQGCLGSSGPTTMGLGFTAQNDGNAADVQVSGASVEDERCVSGAVRAMRLPAFQGKPVPVKLPLNVFRPQLPPPPVAQAAPPAPSAPPPPPPGSSYALPTMPTSAPPAQAAQPFIQP
jgi:hypothetical protein